MRDEPLKVSVLSTGEPMLLDKLVSQHIERVLAEQDGNVSAAARALGMHRRTLQRKLRKYRNKPAAPRSTTP